MPYPSLQPRREQRNPSCLPFLFPPLLLPPQLPPPRLIRSSSCTSSSSSSSLLSSCAFSRARKTDRYGHKDVKSIASVVGTRSATQVLLTPTPTQTTVEIAPDRFLKTHKQPKTKKIPNSCMHFTGRFSFECPSDAECFSEEKEKTHKKPRSPSRFPCRVSRALVSGADKGCWRLLLRGQKKKKKTGADARAEVLHEAGAVEHAGRGGGEERREQPRPRPLRGRELLCFPARFLLLPFFSPLFFSFFLLFFLLVFPKKAFSRSYTGQKKKEKKGGGGAGEGGCLGVPRGL
uniref:Uncharacterized protein n=1 Tax=Rhodomonas salina TaxID=3034 RepID=A2T3W8_RHDSA|nr:hypothetical protein [Rhodomonas salina]